MSEELKCEGCGQPAPPHMQIAVEDWSEELLSEWLDSAGVFFDSNLPQGGKFILMIGGPGRYRGTISSWGRKDQPLPEALRELADLIEKKETT